MNLTEKIHASSSKLSPVQYILNTEGDTFSII